MVNQTRATRGRPPANKKQRANETKTGELQATDPQTAQDKSTESSPSYHIWYKESHHLSNHMSSKEEAMDFFHKLPPFLKENTEVKQFATKDELNKFQAELNSSKKQPPSTDITPPKKLLDKSKNSFIFYTKTGEISKPMSAKEASQNHKFLPPSLQKDSTIHTFEFQEDLDTFLSSKSTTADGEKKAPPKLLPPTGNCVVFFKMTNDISDLMNKKQAETHLKMLPVNLRQNCTIKVFKTQEELDTFVSSLSKQGNKPTIVTPQRPRKPQTETTSQGNQLSSHESTPKRFTYHYATVDDNIHFLGTKFKVHFFPHTPKYNECTSTVIFLEFVDTKNNMNHWLHRPMAWATILNTDAKQEDNTNRAFPEELHTAKPTNMRKTPYQDGDKEKFEIKKTNKNKDFRVLASGLYYYMPSGMTPDQLRSHICETWSKLFCDSDIPGLYCHVVRSILPPGAVINTLTAPSAGGYWRQLTSSLSPKKLELLPHDTLDEIFLDETISTIMSDMFAIDKDACTKKTYSEDVVDQHLLHRFAYNM